MERVSNRLVDGILRRGVIQAALGVFFVALLLGGSGCASPAMKGTPFYSDLSPGREGPAQDRVNLWPLLYYRDPVLSILWPLLEYSDESFAIRPIFSVDGLGQPKKEYSVLWPLGSFNQKTGANYFFPFFWGDNYCVGFPLFWQSGHPIAEKQGYNTLFPLWWYYRSDDAYSLYAPWPLFHVKREGASRGWHIFPLAGSYNWEDGYYRYQAFPLAHQYKAEGGAEHWNTVLPLYFYSRTPRSKLFLSLPWSSGKTTLGQTASQGVTRDELSQWQLLFPLYYNAREPDARMFATVLGGYSRNGDDSSWMFVPLLAKSKSTPNSRDTWVLGPLIHSMSSPETATHHVLPLYYSARNRNIQLVVSLLGVYSKEGDELTLVCLPLLAISKSGPKSRDIWLLGPMIHSRSSPVSASRHVLPLFYAERDAGGTRFFSLPWSCGKDKDGRGWQLLPPLYYRAAGPDGSTLITPLWSQGVNRKTGSKWQALMPLFFAHKAAQEKLFATLMGGWRTGPDGRKWLIYPLLSWGNHTPGGGEAWIIAPLAHAAWGNRGPVSHVFPLYYWNKPGGTLVTPLWAKWKNDAGTRHALIPPLLSWLSASPERRDLWCLGPTAHFSWGEKPGPWHIFPLLYRNPEEETTVSPLWANWRDDGGMRHSLVPPLLSWLSSSPERRDLWCLGPMAHFSWGEKPGPSHILPLIYRNPEEGTTLTPLVCTWRNPQEQSLTRVVPPLLSGYSRTRDQKDLWALSGIYHDRWTSDGRQSSHLLPLYHWQRDDHFYTPLFGWQHGPEPFTYFLTPLMGGRGGPNPGFWFFPFADYERNPQTGDMRSRFLWGQFSRTGKSSRSIFFPIFGYNNFGSHAEADAAKTVGSWHTGKDFFCIPWCWYRNERFTTRTRNRQQELRQTTLERKQNGIFPLWRYSRETQHAPADAGEVRNSIESAFLLWLFDYKHSVTAKPASPESPEVYTRSRVLWYLWHYQRTNGDVSIDSIPGFTYDRTTDGYKKISLIWRLFRYERKPDGARNLDLLFIPIMRRKGGNS